MLRKGRGIVVIRQPVRLEREITTGARARVVEHLSCSHRNDSHDPAGSHYFTTPALSRRPDGGEDDDSYGLL